MNFATMIDRSYDGLRDAQREFVLPVEVKSWLNESQRDLAHRLKILQKEVVLAADANGEYPLPADFVEARGLRVGPEEADVRWTDSELWWDSKDSLSASPYGGPRARVWQGNIEVYPTPAAGTEARLRYIYEAPDLVADDDVSELPLELHPKMVDYARAMGYLRMNEQGHYIASMEKYERGLPGPPLGATRINPGPMQLRYEDGPFDTQDAAHRG